jgi:hypothetical protein
MKKILLTIGLIFGITSAYAGTNIDGLVESRCTVETDTPGTYGNPNAYTLTTLPASSGQVPIVRFDVSLANAYFAQVSYPTSFSTSPSLSDSTTWTGAVTVAQTSSSDMSGYQAASTTPTTSMRQYALTIAGTTWFQATSVATYGGGQNKAFPGGSYSAVVVAQCIAQ